MIQIIKVLAPGLRECARRKRGRRTPALNFEKAVRGRTDKKAEVGASPAIPWKNGCPSRIFFTDHMWIVYILECADGNYYTGITNDLDKRVRTHNNGKASKYTRSRLPVRLMSYRQGFTRSEALKLEFKIKKQKRNRKIGMLEHHEG